MIEAPTTTYARILLHPRVEQSDTEEYITTLAGTDYDPRVEQPQQPCQAEHTDKSKKVESPLGASPHSYDPRDLIIANLSVENEILKKRLKEFVQASADIRNALDNARDKFAQFRDDNYY